MELAQPLFGHQEFRGDDLRDKESSRSVEELYSRLAVHIGEMAEIPRYEIVYLVIGSDCDVKGITDEFSLEDSAGEITVGKNCRLLRNFDLRQIPNERKKAATVRFTCPFKFTNDEWRDVSAIIAKFVLPPANGQIAPERLALVEISADH